MRMNFNSIAVMKKLMKSLMLFAAAAMALTSCENEAMNEGIEVNDTYTMTFVAGAPESKTSVAIVGDKATFSWSADDKVGFYKVANGIEPTVTNYKEKTNATAAIEGETATFKPTFKAAEGATNYNIGAFYPSDSWVSHADENHFSNVNVKILASQNLTEDSFDPKADLLMSKPLKGVAFSDDAMALQFTRLAAIGKMNLKLTDMVEGEVIESVKFTLAEGTHFNGPVILNFENTSYTFGTEDTSNSVTISGELAANADRTAIFFTCFPGEYSGAYTINVTTDKATYSKEGTINNAMKFTEGNVLDFNATVGNRHVEVLEEGTIVDVLNRGVTGVTNGSTSYTNWTATGTSGVVYAGNSAGNNDAIQLRWDTNKATSGIVTTTSCGTAKKVVVTWDSNTADSRILNIYGSNTAYTSVDDLKNNAGTLLGTIARADQTTLEIEGDYAYIGMRSTSGAMYLDKIEITWKPDSRTALTAPVVSATAEGKNVTVSWGDVENAGSYTLTYGETVVENATSPYEFEGEYSTTYNFSVVAVPLDDTSHKNSAEGTAEVTIEADPNGGGETSGTVTYDFSQPANYGITAPATGNGTEIGNASLVAAPITMTTTDGSSTNTRFWNSSGTITLRVYKGGGSFTFTADSGYTITGIDLSGMSGTISTTVGSYSNNKWTGSANSVTFTVSANATLKTATITYEGSGSGSETPEPEEPVQLGTPDVQAEVSGNTITLTWADDANASSYTVTYGTTTIENATSPCEISNLTYSTLYNFTVVAVGDGTNYTNSEAGTASATTEEDPNTGGGDVPTPTTVEMDIKGTTGTLAGDSSYISWTSGDVTVRNNKTSGSSAIVNSDTSYYRVYAKSEFVISVSEGTISKVVITCTSSSYATAMKNSLGNNATASGSIVTWTGSASEISATMTAQSRINKVDVTYTK